MTEAKVKKIYSFKVGSGIPEKDAQDVGEYLDSVPVKDPKVILKKAKTDKNCPLRKYLDWNNKSAGDKWRLFQIRNIINHVEVQIIQHGNSKPTKAFYSITEQDEGKKYVGEQEASENTDWRHQIITRAMNEQKAWIERYGRYEEVRPLCRIIKKYTKAYK
jgi:hypothetical protein